MIRLASNADVPDVVRVIRSVYDEYKFTWDAEEYHADLYDIERHYNGLGHLFFVAELERQLVGTAALALHVRVPGEYGSAVEHQGVVRVAGSDCSLERLYVLPDARGKGIGRSLLERVMDEASSLGRTAMEMWSDKRFVEAHKLYQRLGARVVGERICHDPDQSPEWGLILAL